MIKRILYLIALIILSLSLVESVRNNIANKVVFPIVYKIGIANNNANVVLASGTVKQFAGKYDDAKEIYVYVIKHNELAKQKRAEELAYYHLGENFYAVADYPNAAKAYYLALKRNPANKDALLRFTRIGMAFGNAESIIPIIKEYVARRPRDAIGYTELCAAYNRVGERNSARVNCQLAIKNNRNYARARYDYSIALNNIGFTKEAEKELKLARKIQPGIKSREELEALLFQYRDELSQKN